MYKLFGKNHNILILTASFILQNVTFDQVNSLPLNQDDGSQISVSSGWVIPQWLTKILFSESISKTYDILLVAIEFSKTSVAKSALYHGLIKETPISQDDFYGDLDEYMIPEGDLIRQFFGWKRFNSPYPLFIDLGADEDIDTRYQALQDYISNKNSGTKQ